MDAFFLICCRYVFKCRARIVGSEGTGYMVEMA